MRRTPVSPLISVTMDWSAAMKRPKYNMMRTLSYRQSRLKKKLLEQFLHVVETQELISHFDERLWLSLVVLVTVYSE